MKLHNIIFRGFKIIDRMIRYFLANLIKRINLCIKFIKIIVIDLLYRLIIKLDSAFLVIIKLINNLWNFYSTILSLPMIYTAKNFKVLLFVLLIAFTSVYFNFSVRWEISISNEFYYILITGTILNLLFIKFNLMVRLFNVLIKTSYYFLNHNISNNIILCYYLFNIICFIVLVSLVNCIEFNLTNYDLIIGEHAQIYTFLFSVIIAMIYLEHTVTDNIEINKIKMNKLSKILSIIFITSITYSFFIYITNVFNPISCDPTSSENYQVNRNNQQSDVTNNEQSNGNFQSSNNKDSNSNIQSNNQTNVNNQIFTNTNENSSNLGNTKNVNTELIQNKVKGKLYNPSLRDFNFQNFFEFKDSVQSNI